MPSPRPHVAILSPGAKVELTQRLAEAVQARGGVLCAWEADAYAPAARLCAHRAAGGPLNDAADCRALLAWCRQERIDVVVPSRHDDLPCLAAAAGEFSRAGVTLALSSPEVVNLCLDKRASHAWLKQRGFPVPEQVDLSALPDSALASTLPLIAKDPRGSGSRQVRLCQRRPDLSDLPAHWIVQSLAPGAEYTINTYADRNGRCICAIPHQRLLVADGEVVRARTARIPTLVDLARRITEALPGARGPLNIQIFWDESASRATVIEINPRFGGGYPLAHQAGGRFTEWLLTEYADDRELESCDAWTDGLLMVRHRASVFFPPGAAQAAAPDPHRP